MAAAGLHLTLNSDDPAFTQSDLGEEYAELARAFGYDFEHMTAIALAGVDATWISPTEKATIRSRVQSGADDLGVRISQGGT
jgi:adenosine deaminase